MTRFTRKVAAAPAAVLAAVGMVVAGGGIALAASHGALQVPFTGHDNRPADAPSATATVNPGLTRTPAAEPSDDATTETSEPSEPSASATPSPSLDGLCVAYQAGAMAKAASNPAFTALITAAGGADQVDAYCVSRIGASTHPAKPTHPARPTQVPTPDHAATPQHRAATPTHPAGPTDVPTVPDAASGTH